MRPLTLLAVLITLVACGGTPREGEACDPGPIGGTTTCVDGVALTCCSPCGKFTRTRDGGTPASKVWFVESTSAGCGS